MQKDSYAASESVKQMSPQKQIVTKYFVMEKSNPSSSAMKKLTSYENEQR